MTQAAEHPAHCRNCGAAAPGKFCPECGQETRVALPTVRELMRDAAGHIVAFDSRLWRSLYSLLFRPGLLTVEYLHGRRKRYVRPARLFFVIAVLMFAVIRLVSNPISISAPSDTGVDAAANGTAETVAKPPKRLGSSGGQPPAEATIKLDNGDEAELDEMARMLPAELRKRVDHFKRLTIDEKIEQINSGVFRFAPYAMVMLLPAFALLQKLSYLPGRRRYPQRPNRYAEHLVYGAHLHAFAFLMIIAIVLMPVVMVRAALALWIVVYISRARRRVYGGNWLGGALRILGVALVYTAMLILTMAALILVAIALR